MYFTGSRYKEGNERHGAPWQERRIERGAREPERERPRFPETRERLHEDPRGPRIKRPLRPSPEGYRNDRRGMQYLRYFVSVLHRVMDARGMLGS